MKKVAMVVGLQFLLGVAIAQDVATVNPERHSGGFAKLPNNKIFQPSQNPIPLEPKTLSQSDKDIANIANQIIDDLRWDFNVAYDEKDAVGRRYRRQDALGTPFCVTVDHQTIEDQTVTIRHRDTMKQDRVKITDLKSIIENEVSMKNWLMKM